MTNDHQASFEHTLKSGRSVTVFCSDWHSAEWDVGLGAGYENVWAEVDGVVLELTPEEEQEIYGASGQLGYPDD